MTTPVRQLTLPDLERLSDRSHLEGTLYVIRRWPLVPLLILGVLVVCAAFAPRVSPYDPELDELRAVIASPPWYPPCEEGQVSNMLKSCNTNGIALGREQTEYYFLLGADALGRDVLSRMIHGARVSLSLAAIAITVGTLLGTTMGLVAGYYGGVIDELIMRFTDVFTAIPYLLLALVVVMVFGQSFTIVALVLALASWPGIVRLVRGQTLQIRNFDYVALARVAGASTPRILIKHLLPGVSSTLVVVTTLQVGNIILAESILSFLGAGVPPPTPSWGADISAGRIFLGSAWWIAFFPGMAIFLTVFSFNFMGDWLRDRWDPRMRQI